MRIRFLSTQIYEAAPGKGPTFEAGSILASEDVREKLGLQQDPTDEWLQAFMNRWLQRGVAVVVDASNDDPVGDDISAADSNVAAELGALTRPQLDALAAKRGVDVSAARNKGDVIATLIAADMKEKHLDDMTVDELKAFAAKKSIDISSATDVAGILAALKAAA
ncbi:hypothetical protein [Devosia sp. 63-57]|mgnify:CR=1 FL=1|uniref:hypothetical protein n=1 Tax=Devosia sp. 63-57 TaxID=1895751 RepID=UPI000869904B|nr:hypothetical protein [Devosia sp. 63-57]ODT50267.1 MAG: hypothetical protein ABS74_04950 [Pelagibacterium sp. SCN 63-126]ODU83008.1 MAG: hypothetical protein ABT14_16115 [Pelagibacterium sp. SCN 63-17]OJX45011.1 MAG: hypothetical protein BGO80_03950 [Devosia sp. 63-57]